MYTPSPAIAFHWRSWWRVGDTTCIESLLDPSAAQLRLDAPALLKARESRESLVPPSSQPRRL
jgi:hypothetical protein